MHNSLLKSVGINIVFSTFTVLLQIALTAVAARVLSPTDYGRYAIVGAIISISASVGSRGLSITLIRSDRLNPNDITNAYISSLVLGLIVAMGLAASSYGAAVGVLNIPLISKDPELCSLAGVIVLVQFITTPAMAILQRRLETFKQGIISLSSVALGSGVVTIGCALGGAGPWSLVFGALTAAGVNFGASLYYAAPKTERRIDPHGIFFTLREAFTVSGLRAIDSIWLQLPILMFALSATPYDLGILQRMQFLSLLVFQATLGNAIVVVMPIVGKIYRDTAKTKALFLETLRLASFFSSGIAFIAWFNADTIIRIFFGPQWSAGVPTFRNAVIAGMFFSLSMLAVVFEEGVGRSRVRYIVSSATLLTLMLMLVLGHRDAAEVSSKFAISAGFATCLGVALTSIRTKSRLLEVVVNLTPAFGALGAQGFTYLAISNTFDRSFYNGVILLACSGAVFIATSSWFMFVSRFSDFRTILERSRDN